MILTNENYYSREANEAYMSGTQYKAFKRCPAAAMAELRGEYTRPVTTALLVGSYVDAHFEGTLDLFKARHPEIFKRDGSLKSEYNQANMIIARCEEDRLFTMLMSGKKQVIRTGKIAGVPFKIKIDSLLDGAQTRALAEAFPDTMEYLGMLDGLIVDLKIMRDMQPIWSDGEKKPFAEAWGYDTSGAIYQEIEGNMLPFALAVATKEPVTDLDALVIPDDALEAELREVEEYAPIYDQMKRGEIEAPRCGHCDYCRMTKQLTGFKKYWEVGTDD
ncbi:MAG: PD-(D/E)XK nuclease-like domain-containing protein [Clostridiales bacterium]|nr:PD-(D/E)XK nuclease-like domain-containing protein [Clostridiales bacterium]